MSDVSRKVVPDKGSLNRERPKPLSFHRAQDFKKEKEKLFLFKLERTGRGSYI